MIPILAAAILTCHSPGVIDGDTIRCGAERVRIWGINSPERSDPAGPAATRAMAALTTGRDVRCEPAPSGQARDRYRRRVLRCFVGPTDLAAEMVRQGQAEDVPKYSRGFYRSARP